MFFSIKILFKIPKLPETARQQKSYKKPNLVKQPEEILVGQLPFAVAF